MLGFSFACMDWEKNMSQKKQVLNFLKKHGYINVKEALSKLFITRLAARIHELKKDGYAIDDSTFIKWGDSKIKQYKLIA